MGTLSIEFSPDESRTLSSAFVVFRQSGSDANLFVCFDYDHIRRFDERFLDDFDAPDVRLYL